MAYPIKSNPEGCVCPSIRGDRTCRECYWSFVKDGSWHGPAACDDAECLVLDVDRLSDADRKRFNL